MGEGRFEDPSADGSLGFFGHAFVFETAEQAEAAGETSFTRRDLERVLDRVEAQERPGLRLVA